MIPNIHQIFCGRSKYRTPCEEIGMRKMVAKFRKTCMGGIAPDWSPAPKYHHHIETRKNVTGIERLRCGHHIMHRDGTSIQNQKQLRTASLRLRLLGLSENLHALQIFWRYLPVMPKRFLCNSAWVLWMQVVQRLSRARCLLGDYLTTLRYPILLHTNGQDIGKNKCVLFDSRGWVISITWAPSWVYFVWTLKCQIPWEMKEILQRVEAVSTYVSLRTRNFLMPDCRFIVPQKAF